MKARTAKDASELEHIPNIGKSIADDLRLLGITKPSHLQGKDPLKLYRSLSKKVGAYIDPCVLDTFMAAVDFANGAPARAWWEYTSKRKKLYAKGDLL